MKTLLPCCALVLACVFPVCRTDAQTNDSFANRTILTGNAFTTTPVDYSAATIEPGETTNHRFKSIWYSWTAPEDLKVSLNLTGTTANAWPRTWIYVGNTLSTIYLVASGTGETPVSWTAVKGVTYQIAFDNFYSNYSGTLIFSMTSTQFGSGTPVIGPDVPTLAAPANDAFEARKVISALPCTVIAYTGSATRQTAEPVSSGYGTLWYSYTAPSDQWLRMLMEANSSDTRVTVYHGDTFGTMQYLGQTTGNSDRWYMMKAGATYHFVIANFYSSTTENRIQLALAGTPIATTGSIVGPDLPTTSSPTNDNFANRKIVNGNRLLVFGYNAQATRESFEPTGTGHRTLWYSWSTDVDGETKLTLTGTNGLDTSLTVFRGNDLGTLERVTGTRSGSTFTFSASKDTPYAISAASFYSSESGLLNLEVQGPGSGVTPLPTRLVNVSTRMVVAAGGTVIPGFVIEGTSGKMVMIRAVGPELAKYQVEGVMPDPQITVFSGSTPIGSNNDWSADSAEAEALREAFTFTGAFGLTEGSKDAALILTLNPGSYTAHVSGVGGVGGDVLMEVYEIAEY